MKHEQKKVSIIVPTKNSATTLDECLISISKQTYSPIELLVVDNFSDDNTPVLAKKYANSFFQRGPERSAQRNFGVEQATGEYICIIDSDMNLSPTVIQECISAIEHDNKIVGVVIPEESFGDGFWAKCKKLERSFYIGVPYMEAARFFRKDDFIRVGGYNTKMVSGEDWDLSQRIETLGTLSRCKSLIYHNEGRISLVKTIKKKWYYAQKFASYTNDSNNNVNAAKQTNIVGRYALFFSQPKKLFSNPIIAIGMLFMKMCEFGFGGVGYLTAKLRNKNA